MEDVERAEDMLLDMEVNNPLCSITVTDDKNYVILEQSLEVTWGGTDAGCRALFEKLLSMNVPLLPSQIETVEDDGFIVSTIRQATFTITIRNRGDPRQPYYLMQALRYKGGIEYFDKTLIARRALLDPKC